MSTGRRYRIRPPSRQPKPCLVYYKDNPPGHRRPSCSPKMRRGGSKAGSRVSIVLCYLCRAGTKQSVSLFSLGPLDARAAFFAVAL